MKHPGNFQSLSRIQEWGQWYTCNCSECKNMRKSKSKERPLDEKQKSAENKIYKI